jgi:anaerobic selenocysteine-containing dehydrogenase
MWRIFAGLGRRLGLPGFADLEAETDDSLLAAAARRSRVPWGELVASPSGVAPSGTPGPGWLIPKRLPRGTLDLAPPELVTQLQAWERRSPAGDGLVLVNHRELRQTNSMLRQTDRPPALLMHPDDCIRFGLADGQSVRIASDHGATDAIVGATAAIRPGVVSIPHGWATPGVNRLTSASTDVDPLTGMPRFSGVPVEVTGS